MASSNPTDRSPGADESASAAREVLGHLNFSTGKPEPSLHRNIDLLCQEVGSEDRPNRLRKHLLRELDALRGTSPAFADCKQAEGVIDLTLGGCLAAYRSHHADLLFHLPPEEFEAPFLLGRMFEAVLLQGEPWDDRGRIVQGAVTHLNDFVGYRPIAVLENGRKMEIYDNERFRCVPIFIEGAGVASGDHHDLIEATLAFLRESPQDLLHAAHFDLQQMHELAIDVRAHDQTHPVNKRTNYLFGEWDPHQIDIKGQYTRFVLRRIILDALVRWVEDEQAGVARDERLFDAAAALSGTILMASSISGAGPETHDSTVSLTSLLPIIARRRDEFYNRLMESLTGSRKSRLDREAELTQQPFGHVRQYLNMTVASYGARQVQYRELAYLFARMGHGDASRRQAHVIPSASARFECEIQCRVGAARRCLDRGAIERAVESVVEAVDLLHRGIECGALVDPWNILGFHGQFPLFTSREDAIPDGRIETLMLLMDDLFSVYARCLGEAAALGNTQLSEDISRRFLDLAEWWDKFGSDVIDDLPDVSGHESWEAATQVSSVLSEWRKAGEEAGDIGFWKQHVERFHSAQSYAQVIEALLAKGDSVAAMGLMMQWLSQVDEVGFESPRDSIFAMLIRWMRLPAVSENTDPTNRPMTLRRMFEFLEANAGDFWSVPSLETAVGIARAGNDHSADMEWVDEDGFDDEQDEEDSLYSAAYEQVTFRDSADDGTWGDTLDDGFDLQDTEFELINRSLEPRIKFLNAVAQMWQMAAVSMTAECQNTSREEAESIRTATRDWVRTLRRWQDDLRSLMKGVWTHNIAPPSGDHDANLEFDIQWQVKLYVMHQLIVTVIGCRHAERLLQSCLPADDELLREEDQERQIVELLGHVVRGEADAVIRLLPDWVASLKQKQQLLYVPLEHSGSPQSVLNVQLLQTTIRFLLASMPRLGLLRGTFHLLQAVFTMERNSRPNGPAITEFDRAFQVALRRTLEAVVTSAATWDAKGTSGSLEETLVEQVQQALGPFQDLWQKHSETMRLSAVDADGPHRGVDWETIEEFIRTYGSDLFHASQLTLGNVRAILRMGVSHYVDFLIKEQDPLRPIKLVEDLDAGRIDHEDTEWCLEFIYSVVVDKFDRFVEYNTTTTQSDYGENFHCLLDFLRLEAQYDRDAWNLIPLKIAHEVLAREGHAEAAFIWEQLCEEHASEQAEEYVEEYRRLAQHHGMRMPAIADHLNDRFVKPLAVNRMVSLVEQSIKDARQQTGESFAFEKLEAEVDEYLQDSWGSGVDVPEWLQSLGSEVDRVEMDSGGGRPGSTADIVLPQTRLDRKALAKELDAIEKPLRRRRQKGTTRRDKTDVNPGDHPTTDAPGDAKDAP
ncbi:MAG: hypothetical protein KDA93_13665 [Planctomycetaceae bacterium]|nr:hypothetical protein [Planctomycetaceae bacterium]